MHAEEGNIHASFAAWRSSVTAINISALEALGEYFGVLEVWEEIGEVTQSYGACLLRNNRPIWPGNTDRKVELCARV